MHNFPFQCYVKHLPKILQMFERSKHKNLKITSGLKVVATMNKENSNSM